VHLIDISSRPELPIFFGFGLHQAYPLCWEEVEVPWCMSDVQYAFIYRLSFSILNFSKLLKTSSNKYRQPQTEQQMGTDSERCECDGKTGICGTAEGAQKWRPYQFWSTSNLDGWRTRLEKLLRRKKKGTYLIVSQPDKSIHISTTCNNLQPAKFATILIHSYIYKRINWYKFDLSIYQLIALQIAK
jgi:hypothetical protein